MITVECHLEEDEVFILDETGRSPDLQMLVRDDAVILTQICQATDDVQVIMLTPEQFANIYVSLELDEGTYLANGQKVNLH